MEAIDGAVGVSAEEVLARGGVEGSLELTYGGGLAEGGFEVPSNQRMVKVRKEAEMLMFGAIYELLARK